MDKLSKYSFEDSSIIDIKIKCNHVEVVLKLWNDEKLSLIFNQYWKLIESSSLEVDIGEIIVEESSELLNEVKKHIIEGDGSEEEIKFLKHYSFISAWNDKPVLEIVSNDIEVT